MVKTDSSSGDLRMLKRIEGDRSGIDSTHGLLVPRNGRQGSQYLMECWLRYIIGILSFLGINLGRYWDRKDAGEFQRRG